MVRRYRIPGFVVALAGLGALAAVAQDSGELLARMKAMEDRIKSLETELQELKGRQAATTAALTAATPAPPAPAIAQALPAVTAEQASAQPSVALGGAGP